MGNRAGSSLSRGMRSSSTSSDELVRARLAYVSSGHPPLGGPRRAADGPEPGAPPVTRPEHIPSPSGDDATMGAPAATSLAPPPAVSWRDRVQVSRRHVIAAAVLVICGVVLALVAILRTQATEVELIEPVASPQPTVIEPAPVPSPSPAPRIRVHVLGAVHTPGVVTLDDGAIVVDALEAAGGLTEDARPGQLNLAERVVDGMQVLVGIEGQDSEVHGAPATETSSGGGKVNLNTATASQLEALPGVGPVTASAIISWRERSGGFGSVAQLQEVDGIGPKTFAKLEPLVTT